MSNFHSLSPTLKSKRAVCPKGHGKGGGKYFPHTASVCPCAFPAALLSLHCPCVRRCRSWIESKTCWTNLNRRLNQITYGMCVLNDARWRGIVGSPLHNANPKELAACSAERSFRRGEQSNGLGSGSLFSPTSGKHSANPRCQTTRVKSEWGQGPTIPTSFEKGHLERPDLACSRLRLPGDSPAREREEEEEEDKWERLV